MIDFKSPFVWLLGVALLGVAILLLRSFFSTEARERRRRDRSHRRVVSKSKRPTVKFAVRTERARE